MGEPSWIKLARRLMKTRTSGLPPLQRLKDILHLLSPETVKLLAKGVPDLDPDFEEGISEAAGDIPDLTKTLNSLVKYGEGKWKSEKQAKYILSLLDKHSTPAAKQWAQQYHPEGHWVAVEFVTSLVQYGHYDPSKIRYVATFFLVDETGVKARAKAKVSHPKAVAHAAGDPSHTGMAVSAEGAEETFVRPATVTGKAVDIAKAELTKEQDRADRIAKNAPLIARIKNIPGWESKSILTSFVAQLEDGRPLSLKQMSVIDTMDPPKVTGDLLSGITKMWDEITAHLEKSFIPIIKEMSVKYGWPGGPALVDRGWQAVLDGNDSTDATVGVHELGDLFLKLNVYIPLHQFLPYAGGCILAAYRQEINKAKTKLKTGKPLTKGTAKALNGIAFLHDKIMKVSEAQMRKMYADALAPKKESCRPMPLIRTLTQHLRAVLER